MTPIQEIRERLGLSQEALGGELGCTQGNIGAYEAERATITPGKAIKLVDLASRRGLGITLDQVYGRVPLPPRPAAEAHSR